MYSEQFIVKQEAFLRQKIMDNRTVIRKTKWLGKLGLGLAIGGLLFDEYNESKIISRNLRTIRCGLNILYQYKVRFDANNAEEVHEIIAKDIYTTCIKNDGLYVKFGQGIAASDHLLPPAYFKWMSLLQDKASAVPIDRVKQIITEETGQKLEDIFSEFEDKPVASASIAQVHKAKLKNGDVVAVKVQKPNIKKQFKSDMFMHWVICSVLQYAFDLPLLQFQKSIEDNLEKEIDFTIEYQNGEISRKALQIVKRTDVHIPTYYKTLNSRRLLVSEWVDGIKITHLKEIEALGFNTKEVMETVISTFAEQIFITGFVHCDPHPGNIFVRKDPKNQSKYQVVLLDFGLCLKLDNTIRLDYAKFWTALFLQDHNQIKEIISKWGIGNQDMFASMQLMKPYQPQKPVHCHQVSAEEVLQLQMKMKSDIKEMMKETHLFPQDLLFVNRNMNLVRSVNKRCGSKINRINVMARYAQQGAQIKQDVIETQSYNKQLTSSWMFEMRLWVSSVLYNLLSIWLKWKSNKSVEDFLEEQQKQKFQGFYKSYGFKVPDERTFDA